jgi:chlorobactene glucosyltransferase
MEWPVLLAVLPWLAPPLVMLLGLREPRSLPPAGSIGDPPLRMLPSVAIVVPARNEERNVVECLRSLADQEYPRFSIVLVDDRSTDGTAARARGVPRGNASDLRVVAGGTLPSGWFGKPWACQQGSDATESDLILFTDADTRHAPSLLGRAVAGLLEDEAAALSVKGWQALESFGEKLVQPHVFALLAFRYLRLDRPVDRDRSRSAIANGQYLLVRRDAYRSIGGHEAVRGEVVEDLRLAQILTGAGHRLTLRLAEEAMTTRMYHSLREVVNGWTKNLAVGARQSVGRWAPFAVPGILAFLLVFWLAPPLLLAAALGAAVLGTPLPEPLVAWSAAASGIGLLFWIAGYRRLGVSPLFALLYPAGAGIAAWIVARSWMRGERRIEWKGRRYVRGETAAAEESP